MSIPVFFILSVVVIMFVVGIITRSATDGRRRGLPRMPRACPQCGEANPGQAAYCRKCGRALR
jgi:hypothetical protein